MCGGAVVRGGVEPLDRVHHAGVVHLAEKCHLWKKYFNFATQHQSQNWKVLKTVFRHNFKRRQSIWLLYFWVTKRHPLSLIYDNNFWFFKEFSWPKDLLVSKFVTYLIPSSCSDILHLPIYYWQSCTCLGWNKEKTWSFISPLLNACDRQNWGCLKKSIFFALCKGMGLSF